MKKILITGGTGGIGSALCHSFYKEGYAVSFTYHTNEKQASALCDELEGTRKIKADLRNPDNMSIIDDFLEENDGVDCLINNAGVSLNGLFQDFTLDDYNNIFGTNVLGGFLVTKKVLPFMIRKHSGNIINISSIWGMCGGSCEVLYSASKSAVEGFTKALAKEVGLSGIRVNCIAPGVIDTPMNNHLSAEDISALKEETPLNKIGSPADVANLAVFLCSEKSSFITGQIISPNGGIVI